MIRDNKGKILKTTEDAVKQKAEAYFKGFEYVGGYTGCECYITVRCKACGNIEQRSYVSVRHHGSSKPCPICAEKRKQLKEAQQKAEQKQKECENCLKRYGKLKASIKVCTCIECGKTWVSSKEKGFCSDKCRKRKQNRKKDHRIPKDRIIDKDITIGKLYSRDKGRCYICGRQCDWKDYIIVNGTTICGDNYPSVEHVIPISKGGYESWDNVKLACRRCNTLKRDKSLVQVNANGQLQLVV